MTTYRTIRHPADARIGLYTTSQIKTYLVQAAADRNISVNLLLNEVLEEWINDRDSDD
jgi:predicted HicB family RNase H-like nuclease